MNTGIKTLRNNYSMGDFYFQLRCRGKYDTLYITSCTPRLYKKEKSVVYRSAYGIQGRSETEGTCIMKEKGEIIWVKLPL